MLRIRAVPLSMLDVEAGYRGESDNNTHLNLNSSEKLLTELPQSYNIGSHGKFNQYEHGIKENVKYFIEDVILKKSENVRA
jgi:hypothetical protein